MDSDKIAPTGDEPDQKATGPVACRSANIFCSKIPRYQNL